MQFEEFMELQQCLIAWYNVFRQHDSDGSGFMDAQELLRVIKQLFGKNWACILVDVNR
jgi:Ca2+-binding EF-hand superfamily protein